MRTFIFTNIMVFLMIAVLAGQTKNIQEDTKLFAKGYAYILESKYAEALGAFDLFMKTYPQSAFIDKALFWEAWCHTELKNYGMAIKKYDELAQKFPKSNYADDALYKTGEIYENYLHDYDNAVKTYERLINIFPLLPPNVVQSEAQNISNTVVQAKQQVAQIQQERYRNMPQALNEWEKSQQLDKQAASVYGEQPISYFNKKAQEQIDFIKTHSDNNYVPLTKLIEAEVLCREGNYDRAVDEFSEIIKEYPQSAVADNALYDKYLCLIKQNRIEEAKASLKTLLHDYPNSTFANFARQILQNK